MSVITVVTCIHVYTYRHGHSSFENGCERVIIVMSCAHTL